MKEIHVRENLTQEKLRERYTYHPGLGFFTRNYESTKVHKVNSVVKGSKTTRGLIIYINRLKFKGTDLVHLYMKGSLPGGKVEFLNGDMYDIKWKNLKFLPKESRAYTKIYSRNDLTQDILKQRYDYNENTGKLVRKYNTGRMKKGSEVSGYTNSKGTTVTIDKFKFLYSHLIWLYHTGVLPTQQVIHKNGDVQDTRWSNLKLKCDTDDTQIEKWNTEYLSNGRKKLTLEELKSVSDKRYCNLQLKNDQLEKEIWTMDEKGTWHKKPKTNHSKICVTL